MVEEPIVLKENVPRKTKFSFGIGGFASGLLTGFVFSNLTFFYDQVMLLDKDLIGLAWLIFAIWNTINDPIFSYFIDNTRTKLGRRIPFIRYGSVFFAISYIFAWTPIARVGDQIGLFLNLLLVLFIHDTLFTIIGCCFFSLPNEIAITAKQRASLTLYSSVFGFINIALGLFLPIILLTPKEGISPFFYPVMFIIAIGCAALMFFSSYGIKENMFAQSQPHEGFIEGLKKTLKNRAFWILMAPAFVLSMIVPLIQTGILYYIKYVIVDQDILPMLAVFVALVVVGLGVTLKLLDKWRAKKTAIFSFTIFTAAFTLMFFFGYNSYAAIFPFAIFGWRN